jgi:putative restriction endonuclease
MLLGWSEEVGVFVAFDVMKHRTFGRSVSIQVRSSTLQEAYQSGYGFQTRRNAEIVVAFTPDQVINYLLHQRDLHAFGEYPNDAIILSAARTIEPTEIEGFIQIPEDRQIAVTAVNRWVRERTFRDRVLSAYGHHCSVCHLQLQIVQAAHIVPVHIPGSSDTTSNGLALCPSHHAAYDGGLLGVAPNYHVVVSEAKLNHLRSQGLHGGEETVLERVCNTIRLPSRIADRPNPEYLQRGMQIRGWPPIYQLV